MAFRQPVGRSALFLIQLAAQLIDDGLGHSPAGDKPNQRTPPRRGIHGREGLQLVLGEGGKTLVKGDTALGAGDGDCGRTNVGGRGDQAQKKDGDSSHHSRTDGNQGDLPPPSHQHQYILAQVDLVFGLPHVGGGSSRSIGKFRVADGHKGVAEAVWVLPHSVRQDIDW